VVARVAVGAIEKRVRVDIDALVVFDGIGAASPPDSSVDGSPRAILAVLAIVDATDSDAEFSGSSADSIISVDNEKAEQLLRRRPMSDRALRRYLAQSVYIAYSESTLAAKVNFDRLDELITGNRTIDFERNAGLLLAEGYLTTAHRTKGDESYGPTASLVRSVEQWGGPKEDVVGERNYESTIAAYQGLTEFKTAILLEWSRFLVARSGTELTSIFRSLAPLVEKVLGRILASHGSAKASANLGPMVTEMQQRRLGDRALWSRLNHVVTFARDLAEHGEALSDPAMRIACESAFDLIPQLAALARAPSGTAA